MKRLIILVGNIASGKTTLVKDLVKLGYLVLSRDDIRYMLGGGEYIWDTNLEKIIKDIQLSLLRKIVRKKYDVVIDGTNMSMMSREDALAIANKAGYETIAYVMPKISKKKSVERRLANNHGNTTKKQWEDIWLKFDMWYEEPTHEEGFNKIHHKLN